ncbi:hypothetical protein N9B82_03765 [Saprospiraceae bacterium]|nr:hypothetical protein [Saprospiraceae bacterium]
MHSKKSRKPSHCIAEYSALATVDDNKKNGRLTVSSKNDELKRILRIKNSLIDFENWQNNPMLKLLYLKKNSSIYFFSVGQIGFGNQDLLLRYLEIKIAYISD